MPLRTSRAPASWGSTMSSCASMSCRCSSCALASCSQASHIKLAPANTPNLSKTRLADRHVLSSDDMSKAVSQMCIAGAVLSCPAHVPEGRITRFPTDSMTWWFQEGLGTRDARHPPSNHHVWSKERAAHLEDGSDGLAGAPLLARDPVQSRRGLRRGNRPIQRYPHPLTSLPVIHLPRYLRRLRAWSEIVTHQGISPSSYHYEEKAALPGSSQFLPQVALPLHK